MKQGFTVTVGLVKCFVVGRHHQKHEKESAPRLKLLANRELHISLPQTLHKLLPPTMTTAGSFASFGRVVMNVGAAVRQHLRSRAFSLR